MLSRYTRLAGLAGLLIVGCRAPAPARDAAPPPAPAAASSAAASAAETAEGPWATARLTRPDGDLEIRVQARPSTGAPTGEVVFHGPGAPSRASLQALFGASPWPEAETWKAEAKTLTVGDRTFAKLVVEAEHGEDLRISTQRWALFALPLAQRQPVWAGDGHITTIEMNACILADEAKLTLEGSSLVVTHWCGATWMPPDEEENSQTPSFAALKASCRPRKNRQVRVPLP